MIICSCKGISDRQIQQLIQQGCKNLKDLMSACPIGRDCGSCLCQTREMISALHNGSKDRKPSDHGAT